MALLFQLTQRLALGFQGFWDRWPHKRKKPDAEKAWKQKVHTRETEDKIHAALDWQIPEFLEREPKYRPYPASWLRGECWNDVAPEPPTPPKPKTISPATVTRHVSRAEQQLDARNRIHSLIAAGMSPEDAKDQVYRAIGWIK
jgi:hypothetical protein